MQVGLKSHIVPTGAVKSDAALFPYVQYPITIGEAALFKCMCFSWTIKEQPSLLLQPSLSSALSDPVRRPSAHPLTQPLPLATPSSTPTT